MQPDLKALILHEIQKNSDISQRKLAQKFQISLGKINFILKELSQKGYIKIQKFAKSDNKLKYRYILTPAGMKEKIRITKEFIIKKMKEYEELVKEVEEE